MRLLVRRSASARLRFVVAIVAAILFAVAPGVQACCSIGLPVGALAAAVAADDGGAEHGTPCCDEFPEAAIDDRASPKDGAPLVGKPPVPALARSMTAAVLAAAPAHIGYDPPPPEPVLRRLPRLLL